mgnify:CR=1 FL=1
MNKCKYGGGLLELPCAYGKTVLSLNIISRLNKKTFIIVHKEFLMNQWIERIQQFLPKARIGKIQGQIIDIDDKDNLLITSNWRSDSISIIDLAKQEYLYEIKTGKQSRSFGQFIKID